MRLRFSLITAVAVSACQNGLESPNQGFHLRTDRLEYEPLQPVIVTTVNHTTEPIFDDHCGGQLEGKEYLGYWNGSYGSGRACILLGPGDWRQSSHRIDPNASGVDTFDISANAYTGTWRVQLLLRTASGDLLPLEQRVSNTFRIAGTWKP